MTFMHQESIEWARRFFRWELEQGVSPDFFAPSATAWYGSPLKSRSISILGSQTILSPLPPAVPNCR